jgi:putative membrane protein
MAPETAHHDEHILRDRLALDRTRLANERTLLAYLRTTLVLVLGGVTALKLFPKELAMVVIAGVLLVVGLCTGVIGAAHFLTTVRRMNRWSRRLDTTSRPEPPPDAHP